MKTIWVIKYLCFVFAVLLFTCCSPNNENNKRNINTEVTKKEKSEGTKKMVSILKSIADSAKFYDYFYLNTERAQYYQSRIPLINDPAENVPSECNMLTNYYRPENHKKQPPSTNRLLMKQ
ncbi:MAG: hypothetical protein IPP29_21335 [Bacteroidetes bacterium]|nr:hypothetical protein [Bacteroidota bacterium]